MKKITIYYLSFFAVIAAALIYEGCSKLEGDLGLAPDIGLHPSGWSDESSNNFHGKYIYDNKAWNLEQCKSCHGANYAGGNTGSSCLTCHTSNGGPQNCRLCHGGTSGHSNPPKALNGSNSIADIGVGVHIYHLDSTKYSRMLECEDCHTPINGFSDPNHIGSNPDGRAEINFGAISRTVTTFPGGEYIPDPVWERNNATCANTYCHGYFKDGNQNAAPEWTRRESVRCGSCHGDPVTGNPNPLPTGNFFHPHFSNYTINTCYQCHGVVIDQSGTIYAPEKHVNGVVNFNVQ